LILPPGFSVLSYAPLSVFELANIMLGEPVYELSVLSARGGGVRSSIGMEAATLPLGGAGFDTLLVGAPAVLGPAQPELLPLLREALADTRRIAGICIGSFTLAEAGLLDGRRATTHWWHADLMRQRFPAVSVEMDRIYIADGPIWTSAGMAAGIDMALGLLEHDLGQEQAQRAARAMVLYHRRAGGQSQHSTMLQLSPNSDRVRDAIEFARRNLAEQLSVEQLAGAACLSPRQFSRVFSAETGLTPAKAVEHLRLEAARFMLEQGRLPISDVAQSAGFGDRERMRRAFLRAFGQTPQSMRNAATPLATI
jgi:transcriptional regulator GlxA family with amidase domain